MSNRKTNVSMVMGRAWGAYRALVSEYPECAGHGQFGVCLRSVWAEVKAAANAGTAAAAVSAEWAALVADGERLLGRLIATTITVARREIGKSRTEYDTAIDGAAVQTWQGYLQVLESIAWGGVAGDIADEAYLVLVDTGSARGRGQQSGRAGLAMVDRAYIERRNLDRAARGYGPLTLSGLIGDACREAIRRYYRKEVKSLCPSALRTYTGADGAEQSYIETVARARESSPETIVVTHDMINSACKDDTDRAICAGLGYGYNQTVIAARQSMSQQAIAKRIKRIRERETA